MKRLGIRSSLVLASSLAACQLACGGSSAPSPSNAAGSGGTPSTIGSGGASAGAPSAGAPTGGQANAGSAGSLGSGGSSGGAGGAGNDGTGGSGVAGSGGTTFGAIKCSPTGTGDGKHDLTTTASPPEWTLQNGATAGTVTAKASFVSASYTPGHFSYWVYTSSNYVKGSPAVFLMFGDGNQFLTDFHTATVLDNLTATHDLPPTVALFVDPPSDGTNAPTENDRKNAYDPPTDKYTTLLFNEILPAVIFDKYSISRDPDAWAVVGYSASGGQGWKVLWNRPNDIHKFVGISSSFGAAIDYNKWDWVAVVTAAPAPARPLRVSLLASTKDLSDNRGDWLTINTNMTTALAAKGDQTRFEVAQAACNTAQCGHYPPIDGERDFPNALRWTFQGCKF